ncbi:hypothetical protein ACFL5K_02230 [Gemmatimonadota bacterium]
MIKILFYSVLICLLSSVHFVFAANVKIPVIEDTGISNERGHLSENSGKSVTVPVNQNQNWSGFETEAYLMRFDMKRLESLRVEEAWFNIYVAKGDFYGLGLCTVLNDSWYEGAGLNGQEGQGGASWYWASEPEDAGNPASGNYWSWTGSGIYSVSWAHPDSRYSHAGPSQIERIILDDGTVHLRIPVKPELVQALSSGLAGGLVLTDDKGQVKEALTLKGAGTPYVTDLSQHSYVYASDIQDESLRPYLEVEAERSDAAEPGEISNLVVTKVNNSESSVTVSFNAPIAGDKSKNKVLGYDVRYTDDGTITESEWNKYPRLPLWAVPRPMIQGVRQQMRIFTLVPGEYRIGIRAVGHDGRMGSVATCSIKVPELDKKHLDLKVTKSNKAIPGKNLTFEDKLYVWACPDLCKVDPLSGKILLNEENYRDDPNYKKQNNVWFSEEETVKLSALKGEVTAFQLILERLNGKMLTDVKIKSGDLVSRAGKIDAENISVFRVWYVDVVPRQEELIGPWELVEDKGHKPAWHGDACIPLESPFADKFSIPAGDNIGPVQLCQSAWVDLSVPLKTKEGVYEGVLEIQAAELNAPARIKVKLEILPFVMQTKLAWKVDLNAYGYGLNALTGISPETEYERYVALERKYMQMAHQHRAVLNILPYGQTGQIEKGCAPELETKDGGIKVSSWDGWDKRFGLYLSGKAFTKKYGYKGPRQGEPLSHIYLPFNETWPLDIKEHYSDWADIPTKRLFAEWAKTSGPLEEAFSEEYQQGVAEVARQFFRHFKKKKFNDTAFQVYYNNKYYFKVDIFGVRREGGVGSSFWLLDEPVDYDDFAANSFFMGLIKKGYKLADAPKVELHLRTDVSQPELSRGLWDDICNLWTSSGLTGYGSTAAFRMKRLPEEKYWEYGGGPRISGRLMTFQALFLSRWSLGTDGQLPYWDTLRGEGWFKPSDLAIFYSGTDYARTGKTVDQPIAGVRLKAMRRAQQDIEYLNLLSNKHGWDRAKAGQALTEWADNPSAAVPLFKSMTADSLFELRKAIVDVLRSAP